jgi:hypothetical protein
MLWTEVFGRNGVSFAVRSPTARMEALGNRVFASYAASRSNGKSRNTLLGHFG